MKWQVIVLQFCIVSLLGASSTLFYVGLHLGQGNVLVDVRLNTIISNAETPTYRELHQIGVTHLGTPVEMKHLYDWHVVAALIRWIEEVHSNGFLTFASIGGEDSWEWSEVARRSVLIGFDEIELDEMLSGERMSELTLVSFIHSFRNSYPVVGITVTEYKRVAIASVFKHLSGMSNVRVAYDEYNNLTEVAGLSQYSMRGVRLGAWTIIVDDPAANWWSYEHVLSWIRTIRRLGFDLLLFTITDDGAWKVKWGWVVYALSSPVMPRSPSCLIGAMACQKVNDNETPTFDEFV